MAIGVHYVFRCIRRRRHPEITMLAILIIAPCSSLILNFVIMALGKGWNLQRILELYKWRAGAAEVGEHDWGKWFTQLWKHAITNFSLPVLIIAISYLTFGQLFVLMTNTQKKTKETTLRRFPQFWFFILPAIFQLFLLKGCLWKHETWERPLILPVAVSAALGIMVLYDILERIRPLLAKMATVVLILIITVSCIRGLNHYHSISHFSPAKVKLFTMLNKRIPPDKALLSPIFPFEGFIANQHKTKGAFYRPEVAWYLDREIVQAITFEEIQEKAKTGRFPCYLIPDIPQLNPLMNQLQKRYRSERIPADPGGPGKSRMLPYRIFDLRSSATAGS